MVKHLLRAHEHMVFSEEERTRKADNRRPINMNDTSAFCAIQGVGKKGG
jgi:hypothetical protein